MPPDEPDVSPFSGLLGVEWLSHEPDDARARIEVRDDLKQPYGYLHGGVICSVIDEMCSRCTVLQVLDDGMVALGQSLEVSFLRSIGAGGVNFTGRARHRGKTTWVWDVEVTDREYLLCALAKVTVAVRPFEAPG
jgi:1,4-dihydroxy-2-naphthoyl-CoA hydrolase